MNLFKSMRFLKNELIFYLLIYILNQYKHRFTLLTGKRKILIHNKEGTILWLLIRLSLHVQLSDIGKSREWDIRLNKSNLKI